MKTSVVSPLTMGIVVSIALVLALGFIWWGSSRKQNTDARPGTRLGVPREAQQELQRRLGGPTGPRRGGSQPSPGR